MGHGAAGSKKFKSSSVRGALFSSVLETLETRLFMSAVPNVVNVNWNGKSTRVFQNEYVVALKGGADIKKLASGAGFSGVQSLGSGTYKFHYTGAPASVKNWGDRHASEVYTVEPDFAYSVSSIPNDPLFPGQYYLQNTGQTIPATLAGATAGVNAPGAALPGADVQATDAWDLVPAAKKSVIAVLDTGIDQGIVPTDVLGNPLSTIAANTGGHPDLINNTFVNQTEKNGIAGADNDNNGFVNDVRGWDFFRNDNIPDDEVGHGTEVSGVIAAQVNNQIGVAGVADNTTDILPLKVGGTVNGQVGVVSSSAALAAISYATLMKRLYIKSGGTRGANIIVMNASFGGTSFPFDRITARAVADAGTAGILLVTAAGNSEELGSVFNVDTSGTADFPANFSLNLNNVITVAATDKNDQLASFSSFGAGVQLAAPGTDILTTTFTPASTLGTNILTGQTVTTSASDGYGYVDGTSFSAPIVSGILALEYAAKPTASAADLKNALLTGVDVLPSLSPSLNVAPPVSTRGRANAYKSVRNILNEFVQTDDNRSGSWLGVYGRQGAFVAGDSNALPSFVQASFNTSDVIVPNPSTFDTRALQKATGPGRVVGYLEDPSQINFNLNFNDNQTHRVSFYALDFEHANRSEQIEIVDTRTGGVLSSKTISNFGNGRYVTYDLTGGVTIRITKLHGPDAVLSGIFFDQTPTQTQDTVRIDSNTQGNYIPVYGSMGSFVPGDHKSLPGSVIFGTTGASERVVVSSTTDKRALTKSSSSRGQVSYLTAPKQFTVKLNFRDPSTGLTDPFTQHRVSLYAVDFDNKNRAERIEVYNNATGVLLASQDVTDFSKGKYVTFDVQGNVGFRVISLSGPGAVISGVFLDATPGSPAVFISQDDSTHGSWMGKYGAAGAYVVGNSTGSPKFLGPIRASGDPVNAGPNLKLSLGNGGFVDIVEPSSSDSNALQKDTNPSDRTVGYFEGASFTLDLNVNDLGTHRLSLYFLDFDKKGRTERLQLIDPKTGQIITQRTISNFTKGTYVTYDIVGPVRLRFSRLRGPSAVVSGVFFD